MFEQSNNQLHAVTHLLTVISSSNLIDFAGVLRSAGVSMLEDNRFHG